MALDFPANPVNGQVYDNFYYDSSMGTWRALSVATIQQIPAGVISQFAGSAAPGGYLLCTGQSLATADYPALFAAIGYTYGGSNGSFLIPNLQNKVPVGKGTETEFDALGETGGVKETSLTSLHIPQHTHSINHDHPAFTSGDDSPDHSHGYYDDYWSEANWGNWGRAGSPVGTDWDNSSIASYKNTYGANSRHQHNIDIPAFTGTSGSYGSITPTPVSALQPYIVLNYIIKT